MAFKLIKKLSSRKNVEKSLQKSKSRRSYSEAETESDESSTPRSTFSTTKGALFESLSKQGKFKDALNLVTNSEFDDWHSDLESLEGSDSSPSWPSGTSTPLHIVLAHNPSPDVVQSLVTTMREKFNIHSPEEFPDEEGRTPLHVAVTEGCTSETAEVLLNGEALLMPAIHRDAMLRTPLHWACQRQRRKNKRQAAMAQWHQKQVILCLLKEFPEAAALKDASGKVPLEYAKEAKLVPTVVSNLKRDFDLHTPSAVKASSSQADGDLSIPPTAPAEECLPQKDDISTIGYLEAEIYNVLNETLDDSFD